MEKLGQLRAAGRPRTAPGTSSSSTPRRPARRWTSSTPRSGSGRFLDGRFIRLLTAPAKAGGRAYLKVFSAGRAARSRRMMTRCSAARCSPTCRRSSRPWTRCSAGSASAPTRPTPCSRRAARRSSSSPRPSATRCARRRTSSTGSTRSGCRSPAWSSTGSSRVAAPGLSASRALSAAEQLARRRRRDGQVSAATTAGLLRLHAAQAERLGAAPAAGPALHGRRTPASRWCEVPAARPGHPRRSRACAAVGARPRGRREPDRADRATLTGPLPARLGPARRGRSLRRVGLAGAGRLEQGAPGADVGPALEQGPALALGHAAPHAELGAVVEGVGQALGDDRAAQADGLGVLLGRALDEQRVGVARSTQAPRWAQSSTQLVRLIRSLRWSIVTVTSISPVRLPTRRRRACFLPHVER